MAGYSGTPLPKKLGIKERARLLFVAAPTDFESALGALPSDVTVKKDLRGKASFDVIVFFVLKAAELHRSLDVLKERLEESGGLWIAWPKKASGVVTDVDDGLVREAGLRTGLVDNKVCAIDETWSGLRFVVRVRDRKKKR